MPTSVLTSAPIDGSISHVGYARVVELVDSLASGASVLHGRAGSSPASRTSTRVLTVSERVWQGHALFLSRSVLPSAVSLLTR